MKDRDIVEPRLIDDALSVTLVGDEIVIDGPGGGVVLSPAAAAETGRRLLAAARGRGPTTG